MPSTSHVFFWISAIIIVISPLISKYFKEEAVVPTHYNRNDGQETFVVPELIREDISNELLDIIFKMGMDGGKLGLR